jgi:hypothetical protein
MITVTLTPMPRSTTRSQYRDARRYARTMERALCQIVAGAMPHLLAAADDAVRWGKGVVSVDASGVRRIPPVVSEGA